MDAINSGLTLEQVESLTYLIEECSEVIKASTKILRYGPSSSNPLESSDTGLRNSDYLTAEIQDLRGALFLVNKTCPWLMKMFTEGTESLSAGKQQWFQHQKF